MTLWKETFKSSVSHLEHFNKSQVVFLLRIIKGCLLFFLFLDHIHGFIGFLWNHLYKLILYGQKPMLYKYIKLPEAVFFFFSLKKPLLQGHKTMNSFFSKNSLLHWFLFCKHLLIFISSCLILCRYFGSLFYKSVPNTCMNALFYRYYTLW